MLTGFRRSILPLIMSVVVIVPLGARPARAAFDWTPIITTAITAIGTALSAGNTEAQIRESTRQILAAINTAQSTILTQIESIAVAETRACAEDAVIEFRDIERMTTDNAQRFAMDATACAVLIKNVAGSLTDKGRIDQLGFALGVVSPIAMIARSLTGLSNIALQDTLRTAETSLLSALAPECFAELANPDVPRQVGKPIDWFVECDAYNGDWSQAYAGFYNWPQQPPRTAAVYTTATNGATRNTSRAIAVAVLPLFP
ncbi:MAG TPA: hypothetical protein VGX25_25060 [Actinophytocola sp.]|uniref:hypothetical protein n=1 Tax=Actinophytocola sp. TaxID=1872138 RepID=UPI002DDCFBFB|nr:hypothetical protein [Actinophytocola sp.]HEV2782674.1 hypothetical protein [Actinophytocola sp.]